jgi:hypothetical protein
MAVAEYRYHGDAAPQESHPTSFEYNNNNNSTMQQMRTLDQLRNEPHNSYQHPDLPIYPKPEINRFTQNRTYEAHNPMRPLIRQTPESATYPVEQPYSNKADRHRECSANPFNYPVSEAHPARSQPDKLRTQETMHQLSDSKEKYMYDFNNRVYWEDNSFMLRGEKVTNNYIRTVLKKMPLEKGLHIKPIFVIYNPKADLVDSSTESDDSTHSCELCENEYSTRSNLLRHMRNSHP